MNYHIWIIGCQYNEWDGARVRYFMEHLGFAESKINDASVIIILACSVRQTAVDRILGRVKNWPDKTIIIGGCVLDVDREKFANKKIEIFESGDLKHLFELLSAHYQNKFDHFTVGDFRALLREQNTQSQYIPIMSGCNNFCSYCAVPYTRGREKSRPMDEILDDAKTLIKKGLREIMLLGQNVNSYQVNHKNKTKNQGSKTDFTILLEKLNDLEGDFQIMFTSNHPKDMSDDIIHAVATLPKIKKQIHLPLQSGSDKILKAMNRPYTKRQYLDIVRNVRAANPNIEITTDVIVGFPGESEEDFQKTVETFREVDFGIAFINKYSVRSGTAAEKLGDPIPLQEKQRRWGILNEIANKKVN